MALPALQLAQIDFERGAAFLALGPAVIAGWAFMRSLWRKLMQNRRTRGVICLGLIILVAATASADHPAPALVQLAQIFTLALFALLCGGLALEHPPAASLMLKGLVAAGLVGVASIAMIWVAHPTPRQAPDGAFLWFYAHIRHTGLHLLPATVAAAVLAAFASTAIHRAGWLFAAFALGTTLLWLGGRAPWLGTLAAMGWATWRCQAPTHRRSLLVASVCLALAAASACTLFWTESGTFGWWGAIAKTQAAADMNEASSFRLDIWRACIPFIQTSPWLGYGPDGYRFFLPKMDGQQPHNFLIQIALTIGLPGLLLALVGLRWLLPFRRILTAPSSVAAEAIVVALLVTGLLDGALYHLLATSGLALAAGLLTADRTHAFPIEAKQSFESALLQALPAAAGGLAILIFALHLAVFRALVSPLPPESSTALSARLLRAFPSTTLGLTRWLDHWEPQEPTAALEYARWAQKHSAYAWQFHAWAARFHDRQGNILAAQAELAETLRVQPHAFRKALKIQNNSASAATSLQAPPRSTHTPQ